MQRGRRDTAVSSSPDRVGFGMQSGTFRSRRWFPGCSTSQFLLFKNCQKMKYLLPKISRLLDMSLHIVDILVLIHHQSFCSTCSPVFM